MNIDRNEKNRGGLKRRLRLDWGRSISERSDVRSSRWKWLTRKVQQILWHSQGPSGLVA
jgi:hypothetical protein